MSLLPKDSLGAAATKAAHLTLSPRHADLALLIACVGGVVAIRLRLLLSTDFPINDGALFLAFVQAIAGVFPAIPSAVDYNGLSIPFAYPPLSFWLSAAGVRLGLEPLQIVHRLPILMNIGYVLLFTLLLLRTGHSRLFTALAVLVFGTTFLSYEWLVMGGGLSRGLGSLGLLATLLVLLPAGAPPRTRWSRARLVAGGLCVGVTGLAHLEWGILAAFSALVCLALPRPGWAAYLRAASAVGLVAAAVVAPWFWSVYQAHGLEPFIAASRTSSLRLEAVPVGAGRVLRSFSVLMPFVLLGAVTAARTRDIFWVVFVAGALLLTPRSGRTPMMLALGVLTASGLLTCLVLLKQWAGPARRPVLVGLVLVGCVLAGLRTVHGMRRSEHFVELPVELRQAMAWVAKTHPGARFAVFKEAPWYYNAAAEWFPVLAGAVSTTTVQGREWLPAYDFRRAELAVEAFNGATSCDQLLNSLQAFPRADFVWAEGIDLDSRAAAIGARDRPVPDDWIQLIDLGLNPEPADESAAAGAYALRGPGTVAGCFDAAGYEEVHSNPRVRIFRAPEQRTVEQQEQGPGPRVVAVRASAEPATD